METDAIRWVEEAKRAGIVVKLFDELLDFLLGHDPAADDAMFYLMLCMEDVLNKQFLLPLAFAQVYHLRFPRNTCSLEML